MKPFHLLLLSLPVLCLTTAGAAPPDPAWTALRQGGVVLFRHATAPGVGDPPGFRLGDCTTQRNLDAAGRAEAARIGPALAAQAVPVGAVLSSQWCRTRETAELAFPGRTRDEPIFNSFFDDGSKDAQQTAAARALLLGWKGPGALVVFTHQVNITALTGVVPASAEGVVITSDGRDLQVAGRVAASR